VEKLKFPMKLEKSTIKMFEIKARRKFPQESELVICKVKKVFKYGAYVELIEYNNKEALLHISEISSKWIKNISDYVKVDKLIVCKVMSVNKRKDQINVSLRRVKASAAKLKLESISREKKGFKLLELVAKSLDVSLKDAYELVGRILEKKFGELYFAFENASLKGKASLEKVGIPKEWVDKIHEVAIKNIVPSTVTIKGKLKLTTLHPDGVLRIKKALSKVTSPRQKEDVTISLSVVSPPEYRITVTAPNYKLAEKVIKNSTEKAIRYIEKYGGQGKFIRK
jgi:translation initiation factor 2 subunit 1